MALEHIAGVFLIALANYKLLREYFQERFAKMFIDVGSFAIILLGVGIDFLSATLDVFSYVGLIMMVEGLFIGIALLIEKFEIGKKAVDMMGRPAPPLDLGG